MFVSFEFVSHRKVNNDDDDGFMMVFNGKHWIRVVYLHLNMHLKIIKDLLGFTVIWRTMSEMGS